MDYKCIIINKLSIKHIFFFTFFIISFIKIVIKHNIDKNKHLYQRLFNIYAFSISDLFSFLSCLVIKIRKETKKSKINAEIITHNSDFSKRLTDYVHYNKESNSNKHLNQKFLLLAFIDLIPQILTFLFYVKKGKNEREIKKNNLNILLIFNIISNYLLSRILLKTYFFRHHYVSFAINIFFLIILGILDIIEIIQNNEKGQRTIDIIIFFLIKIFGVLFYSVENVYGKMILMKNFITPYYLLLLRGIFEIILLIFFSIPFIFIKVEDINNEKSIIFNQFWKSINSEIALKIILLIIINFFYNVNIWIIIDFFTPNHLSMANIFEYFGFSIYNLIDFYFLGNKNQNEVIIFLFLSIFVFLLIGAFIHNEVIILNFCKLNEKTKLFLDQEALKDILSTKDNIDHSLMNDNEDDDNDKNDNSSILEMEKNDKI